MPARLVYEVFRRTSTGRVSLGLVTDDFLAKQVVDSLYNELRQHALKPEGQIALAEKGFEVSAIQEASTDWDVWSVNNKNSPTPVFFFLRKMLWNSVPTVIRDWMMGESPDQFSQFPGDIPNVIVAMEPRVE